jgi:putative endonuclease
MTGHVWVYALEFEGGSNYVGLTKDLSRRMAEHRRRQSPSTRRLHGPFRVIYQQAFGSYAEARQHEKFLKSGRGRQLLQSLRA